MLSTNIFKTNINIIRYCKGDVFINKNKIDYISLANVLSAIAVVYLHVNSFWSFEKSMAWFQSDVIECIFYFAVPIFFMITGALLIDFNKKYDIKTYFTKRIKKTVLPYVFWSLIMSISLAYAQHTPVQFINKIFSGIGIYWFFIPLFCIYLCIPIFSFIEDEKKKIFFMYIIIIGFLINILIPFIISIFNLNISYSLEMMMASNFLIYPLIGYMIHKCEISRKIQLVFYGLSIIGLILHIFGTFYLSMSAGHIVETYKGYENLPGFLYSIGIFIFIKYDLNRIMNHSKINKIITNLSSYTFGIYLIHVFVVEFLIMLVHPNINSIIYKLVSPVFYIIICVSILYILKKIPIINKLVP